ncbi:zinc finger protein 318-like [Brachionichthys hirsutus]|uniref:zinc finger protein 318-like n=1 Tax=Brachionichthys hirsutus TaxID=412623 RepID=UPI0036049D04
MYHGRPPPPARPSLPPAYRDEKNRARPPDQVQRDPYRGPPPGSGSHRRGEKWVGGPPRERSPSPRRPAPLDHKLVITVGNAWTEPSGPARLQNRGYPPQPQYGRSRSPDRNRARSRGRSRSRPRSQSPDRNRARSRPRSQSRSPDRNRARSRGRSRSRPCSQSRSPDRNRARSRGRSRSRPRSQSPDRNRARSRGRSRSRPRSQSRSPDRNQAKSRSPDRNRARSRGRSRSRRRSKSRSRSRSRGRSRGRSQARSKSRQRSSRSSSSSHDESRKEFRELETARRRKELEETLSLPTKSILKRRHDSDDSPSLRSSDSPRVLDGSNVSQVAEQLLLAVRGMEPHRVASVLSELQSGPQTAQNAEVREILALLGGQAAGAERRGKTSDDIDDEERFLYGESEEPDPPPAPEAVRHHGLDLYGDVTEEELYGDYPDVAPPLQAQGGVDTRYASRPTITPDQSIRVQVSNPCCPPGAEPLEAGERQALEEYEKLQDLLKTIGLDLGVAEISKMAARTKERLHGNKAPPKTPTRRRRYSSDSSGDRIPGRRSRSSSGRSRGRGGSWSSDDGCKKSSAPPTSHQDRGVKETPPPPLDHGTLPLHGGVALPSYPPPQLHGVMPPNFPPPGYGQYGNYFPYVHQQWPPMYPPPNMAPPPQEPPPTLPFNSSDPEAGAKGQCKTVSTFKGEGRDEVRRRRRDRSVSEEENTESQKQKVLEEREKLKEERENRMKKKEYLMKELEGLRKHQGELLRRKRREKGGHKDPLLQEISHLQEEVMMQISSLRKEHEAAEKKRNEIDKVALILGLSPSDRPRGTGKPAVEREEAPPPEEQEQEQAASGSVMKTSAVQAPFNLAVLAPAPPSAPPTNPFEYYDAGNHWCNDCNVTSGSMFDFFTHLHSKTHKKTLDPYERPWASPPSKMITNAGPEEKLTKPAKGSEFLLPVSGFFCLLCRDFFGDGICAEEHVTTHAHNEKYKKRMYQNPLYEQRRNLDRQAGLASDAIGKKRKHEGDEKRNGDKEDKSKPRQELKDKERKRGEEDDFKGPTRLEEAKPSYRKNNEKYEYSKKEDKYRYSREEEDRDKYSRRDEEDKHTHSKEDRQLRYRKGDDSSHEERPKYEPRADEHKSKYGKHTDSRSKHDNGRHERRPTADKETFKRLESGQPVEKPEDSKPPPPPKPYDPPKILCGPSPAMRAKLRKQSLEAGKSAPPVSNFSFGKFAWKKRENTLEKEAQKVAAEFIKDDDVSATQNPVSAQEPLARSMAVAKEIADKLGGEYTAPPPWVTDAANQGRIRPNLPGPTAVPSRTTMMGKPATLNTFLAIRTQNTSQPGPAPKDGPIFPDPPTQAIKPPKPNLRAPPPKEGPEFSGPQAKVRHTSLEMKSEPQLVSKLASNTPKPVVSTAQPSQPAVVKMVSDVSAPGVPESEQTHAVFVKPPPFMALCSGTQKPEKLKTNLAAAKAQALFDIFYSNVGQSGISSITKPATHDGAKSSVISESQLPTPQAQKLQSQHHNLPNFKPAAVVCSSPSLETQPESEVHLASLWSSSHPLPEVAPSETTSQRIQPEPNPPVQSEAQPGSQFTPQTGPTEQNPTCPTQAPPKPSPQNQIESEPEPQRDQDTLPLSVPSNLFKGHGGQQKHSSTSVSDTPLQIESQSGPEQDQDTEPTSNPENHPDTAPKPQPKLCPKTRGKTTKDPPIGVYPVRQTRSQTRYQTRQQQDQSESGPQLASGHSDTVASDSKGMDLSGPGSELNLEETTIPGDQIVSDTPRLPSDFSPVDLETFF